MRSNELKYYWDLTCPACPEQYDIYRNKGDTEKIAYARFRHECFTVYCPDVLEDEVYDNGGLIGKVPDEWKLEAEEAIDRYYYLKKLKEETIKDLVEDYPTLSKDVSEELLSELYDEAFSDGARYGR